MKQVSRFPKRVWAMKQLGPVADWHRTDIGENSFSLEHNVAREIIHKL
jgi:hypothetical protein